MVARTNKLVPYNVSGAPALAGNEVQYIANELSKIAKAIKSINQIMAKVETQPQIVATAGAPTTTDVPEGTWQVINDTVGGTVKLYANIGGSLKSVALT